MPLEVIGAGLGRTGTLSLKAALEELGFSGCYHMTKVIADPGHARVWDAAARGEPVDWEALFRGYRATVDWPGCSFYQEFLRLYPLGEGHPDRPGPRPVVRQRPPDHLPGPARHPRFGSRPSSPGCGTSGRCSTG
jgi:hypothetical protein